MGLNREEIAVELARYYSRITGLTCRCRFDEAKRKYVVRRMGSLEFTVTPKAAREIVERPPSKNPCYREYQALKQCQCPMEHGERPDGEYCFVCGGRLQ